MLVAAAVVPAAGTSLTEESLRAALQDRLSSFKIPRRIVFITHDDVPRAPTGKVLLFELANLISSRLAPVVDGHQEPPEPARETTIDEQKVTWQRR